MSILRRNKHPRPILTNPVHFIAFGGGIGLMPFAPGTFGTALSVFIFLPLSLLDISFYVLITIFLVFLGFFVCDKTAKDLNVKDHPGIVWDEICGFLIAMIGAPREALWVIVGFLLFRFFDVLKPWPIGWIDRKIEGGLGIMLDDVLAGLFTFLIIQATLLVLQSL